MYWCEEWFATREFNCSWQEFLGTTSDITQPNSECRSLCSILTVYRLKFTMFVFGCLTIQLPFVMRDFKAADLVKVFNTILTLFSLELPWISPNPHPDPHELNFVNPEICCACESIKGVFASLQLSLKLRYDLKRPLFLELIFTHFPVFTETCHYYLVWLWAESLQRSLSLMFPVFAKHSSSTPCLVIAHASALEFVWHQQV
jgi:hypothetical protein